MVQSIRGAGRWIRSDFGHWGLLWPWAPRVRKNETARAQTKEEDAVLPLLHLRKRRCRRCSMGGCEPTGTKPPLPMP